MLMRDTLLNSCISLTKYTETLQPHGSLNFPDIPMTRNGTNHSSPQSNLEWAAHSVFQFKISRLQTGIHKNVFRRSQKYLHHRSNSGEKVPNRDSHSDKSSDSYKGERPEVTPVDLLKKKPVIIILPLKDNNSFNR